MDFDFSKKWDRGKRDLPLFDFKEPEDFETNLLETKCGQCFFLQYNDTKSFEDFYFCGFDFKFLPKKAPPYFASKCRSFNPKSLYSMKPLNERARKWLECLNPESRHEDVIPIEYNEAVSRWKIRRMRDN